VTFQKQNNFVHNYIKILGMTPSIMCYVPPEASIEK